MSNTLSKFDCLLAADGPAAIVIRQWLRAAEGSDAVVFPPTYPFDHNGTQLPEYNIDEFKDGTSVCVIDSVASQANRIEPAFEAIADGKLVPQVIISAKTGEASQTVNLLSVAHRAADAIVRFSDIAQVIKEAINARKNGNSLLLAKLAPTSLLFGLWDSRASQEKIPRLFNSVIRAHNVQKLTRSAQVSKSIDFRAAGVIPDAGEKKLSDEGMDDIPPQGDRNYRPGGVRVLGGIRRDASLNLATLTDITADPRGQTQTLQRYLLGLALVALTYFDGKVFNLRQGCQLVVDADRQKESKRVLVFADGAEKPFAITREDAIAYAEVTAKAFGVGENRSSTFDPKAAKAALKKDAKKGSK